MREKSRILAQLKACRATRHGSFWAALGLAGSSLFGMVAAFGTAPSTQQIVGVQRNVLERLALAPTSAMDVANETFVREERVQRADSISSLLSRLGVFDDEANEFLRGSRETQVIFRQLSPGKIVTAKMDNHGRLQSLTFPLNGKDAALMVERQGDHFRASEEPLATETHIVMKSAEIRYSLFGAIDAAGMPDTVATQLADIFGGDIDFNRDLRKGDRFSVVFESITYLGRPIRIGRILAAEFINNGKSHRAVWFEGKSSQGGYYSPEGKNVRKAFLRSPLEFSRITSGFTSARFHPVLQKWRAHKGIDYGAPSGTRVKATGDGTVEFVGSHPGGYGKVVILRHQSRYTTLYGHLSGFAAGLRKGMRVAQGDVIGFVGATGLATGPHLHYEFRINDVHQNPLAIALPEAPPLTAEETAGFRDHAQAQVARIELLRGTNLALLD